MSQTLLFPPFRLEADEERLWRGSEPVALRPKTFAVLKYLADRPGRLVRHRELLDEVWAGTIVTPGTLNTSIRELRQALGDDARQPRYIETVHRRGFRFVAEVSSEGEQRPAGPAAPAFVPVSMVPADVGLYGREAELSVLEARLADARSGKRQIVFVTGDTGIGKTSVLRGFAAAHQAETTERALSFAWGHSVHQHGEGEAYYPILDALERAIRSGHADELSLAMRRYAPTWLAQLPWLVEAGDSGDLPVGTENVGPARMLREFCVLTEAITRERPLVLVLEDVHWSDAATVDLVGALARRADPARLLLIVSYRPVDAATAEHPIAPTHRALRQEPAVSDLVLGPLSEEAVERYLCDRFGWEDAPRGLPAVIHEQTDGNPLLMVTLTSHVASSRLLTEADGTWRLTVPPEALAERAPEGLQEIVDDQLESLSREEREALEVASVAGDSFTVQALAAGLDTQAERVEAVCGRLAGWGQFIEESGDARWPDGSAGRRFDFQHAAFRRILYGRLSPARRQLLHLRMAERMEAAFAANLDARAPWLAHHWERGGDGPRAVGHLVRAAASARRRFAHREAAGHSRRAIELLGTGMESGTGSQERELRYELGRSIASGLGKTGADMEEEVARSLELSERLSSSAARLPGPQGLAHAAPRPGIRAAMDELPEEQREAVYLRYVSGQDFAEIARITGTPQNIVIQRVLQGLEHLGATLEPEGPEAMQ